MAIQVLKHIFEIKIAEAFSELCQASEVRTFCKIVNKFKAIGNFLDNHNGCSTWFWICLWTAL